MMPKSGPMCTGIGAPAVDVGKQCQLETGQDIMIIHYYDTRAAGQALPGSFPATVATWQAKAAVRLTPVKVLLI